MEKQDSKEKQGTTPYVSFATFNTALNAITEQGVPPTIDRSVLTQFSGANQGLVLSAFRYLGLTNHLDVPTDKFHDYKKADPENRKMILRALLKNSYPIQVSILANGTYKTFQDSFNDMNVQPSVKAKCLSFFLGAAKAAGYQISTYISTGQRTRSPRKTDGGTKKKKPKDPQAKHTGNGEEYEEELEEGMVKVPIAVNVGKTWSVILDEKYTGEEVERFVQIVQITLGSGKKK